MQRREPFCQPKHFVLAEIVGTLAENASALLLRFLPKVAASRGGTIRHRWIGVLPAVVPVRRKDLGRSTDTNRKAIVRTNRIHAPLDERHTLDLEAGYIRPLHFPQLFRNSELVRFFAKQEIENLGR